MSTIPVELASQPSGAAVSHDNASIFIANQNTHCIREVDVLTWQTRTLAGRCAVSGSQDGAGDSTQARFNTPAGIAIVPASTKVLVADSGNHKIRFIDTVTQLVQTLAGSGSAGHQDGFGTAAAFNTPMDLAVSANGSYALVAEYAAIRQVNLITSAVSTLVGGCGSFEISTSSGCGSSRVTSATVCQQLAACDAMTWGGTTYTSSYAYGCVKSGTSYYYNSRNYRTCSSSYICVCVSSYTDGYGARATVNRPSGITLSSDGTKLYVADTYNHRIRMIILATREVRTLVGSSSGWQDGYETTAKFNMPYGIATIPDARRYRTPVPVIVISSAGCEADIVTSASVCEQLADLVPDKSWSGSIYYSASRPPGCFVYGAEVYFNSFASQVECSSSYRCVCQENEHGDTLLVADYNNHRIRSVRTDIALVSTLAGSSTAGLQDGAGTNARLRNPTSIARMPGSGMVLFTEQGGNNKLRSLTSGACTQPITCPVGSLHPEWIDNDFLLPTRMDPYSGSTLLRAYTRMACECAPGYHGENGRPCTPCDLGTFKSVAGTGPCVACPPNSISRTASASPQECHCNAGFEGADGGHCVGCDVGKFKEDLGPAMCSDCPVGQYSSM